VDIPLRFKMQLVCLTEPRCPSGQTGIKLTLPRTLIMILLNEVYNSYSKIKAEWYRYPMLKTDTVTLSDVLSPEEIVARASRNVDRYTSLLAVEDDIAKHIDQLRGDTSLEALKAHLDRIDAQVENRHTILLIRNRLDLARTPDEFFTQSRVIHLSAINAAEDAYRDKTEAIVSQLMQESYGIPAGGQYADTIGVSPVDEYDAVQILASGIENTFLKQWVDTQPKKEDILYRLSAAISQRIADAAQIVNFAKLYPGSVDPETAAFAQREIDTGIQTAGILEQRRPTFKRDISITALVPQAIAQGNKRTLSDQFPHPSIVRAAVRASATEYRYIYEGRIAKRKALMDADAAAGNLHRRREEISGNAASAATQSQPA